LVFKYLIASIAEENSFLTVNEYFLHSCFMINLEDSSSSIIIEVILFGGGYIEDKYTLILSKTTSKVSYCSVCPFFISCSKS